MQATAKALGTKRAANLAKSRSGLSTATLTAPSASTAPTSPLTTFWGTCLVAQAIKTIYPGVGHELGTTYNLSAGHDIYLVAIYTNPNATIPNTSTDPLVRGRTIQIDFGVPAAVSAAPWNNITTASGSVFDLVDFTGVTTKVDVRITEPFTGTNDQGVPNNALGFPASVTSDVLWLGSFDGHDAALPMRATVLIEDLEYTPTARYEVSAFGARAGNDGGLGRLTRYTLGGPSIDVDASDNTANKATFQNLQPDANGTLRLEPPSAPPGLGGFLRTSARSKSPAPLNKSVLENMV